MNDATGAPSPGLLKSAGRWAQWIVFAILALFTIAAATDFRKEGVPDAPLVLLCISVAAFAALAIAHIPPVFSRLPGKARIAAYVSILVVLALFGNYVGRMQVAWEKTPAGEKEAAERADTDKRVAAEQAQRDATAKDLAEGKAAVDRVEAVRRRLEGCFTTFGHRLPALEDPVKAALHNPGSFEHVETVLILPDDNHNNVAMTFRGQNGFGAIRTTTIRAQLIAEDCSVQNIGQPDD